MSISWYSIIFDRSKSQLGGTVYDTQRALSSKITGACYDQMDTENL